MPKAPSPYRVDCPHPAPCWCGQCRSAYAKTHRQLNPKPPLTGDARDEHLARRAWHAANTDKVAARGKVWRDGLTPEQRAERAAKAKEWRSANKDRVRETAKIAHSRRMDEDPVKERERLNKNLREWKGRNTEKVRASDRLRRARVRGNPEPAMPYTRSYIVKRDKRICHLCGEPVVLAGSHMQPLYGVIDHLVPIAMGGPDSAENVRLAHRSCNAKKNIYPANEQLMLVG